MIRKIQNKITNKYKAWRIAQDLKANFRQNLIDVQKKKVHFKLYDKRLETYYYPLIFFFHEAGYQVFLENKNGFLGSFFNYDKYLKNLKNIVIGIPTEIEKTIFITDQKVTKTNNYLKTIELSLNAFARQTYPFPYLLFPYPMHPNTYGQKYFEKLSEIRTITKKTGIFFSGNMLKEAYHHSVFQDFFKVLDRFEILNVLDKGLQENEKFIIQNKEDLNNLWKNDYLNRFVRTDWEWSPEKSKNLAIRIPNDKWLETLAQSNFFLATPGIRMPMCHNIIEAMSVGTIPILQYASHFEPHLKHLKNCLIFENKKDLVQQVRLALQMNKTQLAEMKQNVLQYYESFHTPQSFVKIVEEKQEANFRLYLYAEQVSILAYNQSSHLSDT